MNDVCRLGIIGVGQRGLAFVRMALNTPGVELTALCDKSASRLREFAAQSNCTHVPQYTDMEEMLNRAAIDAVVITVPDFMHAEAATAALRHGKHIMLEKPMAPTVAECRQILAARTDKSRIIQLGFVLREHPVYRKAREVVSSGRLGQIMSVAADESIGVMHGASYMRRWHRKVANSGGFVLAKCSHDLDILYWIIGSKPVKVASFGDCNFFRPEKQRATHCSCCPDQSCRFRFQGEMVVMTEQEKSAPAGNNFDLCVYNSDKDVVDNQVVILEYANGVRATFSLNLFAPEAKRTLKIVGTEGYLETDDVSCRVTVTSSTGGEPEVYECRSGNNSGHGGSDRLFFDEFIHCVRTGAEPKADFEAGLLATMVGNAIEQARVSGQTVAIYS